MIKRIRDRRDRFTLSAKLRNYDQRQNPISQEAQDNKNMRPRSGIPNRRNASIALAASSFNQKLANRLSTQQHNNSKNDYMQRRLQKHLTVEDSGNHAWNNSDLIVDDANMGGKNNRRKPRIKSATISGNRRLAINQQRNGNKSIIMLTKNSSMHQQLSEYQRIMRSSLPDAVK